MPFHPITKPAMTLKASDLGVMLSGFNHRKIRAKMHHMIIRGAMPVAEEYTLMERQDGARGVYMEVFFDL